MQGSENILKSLGASLLESSVRLFPAAHEDKMKSITHLTLGLAGEVGEVVEIVKKAHKHPSSEFISRMEGKRGELGLELADVAIYLLQLAELVGVDLFDAILEKTEFNNKRNAGKGW